eukprot:3135112-Pleurochrysis_carterae.AAC.1
MLLDWRPVSSADGGAGMSGDGEVWTSGGEGARGGAVLATGSEGGAGRKRAAWNVPMTLATRKLKSGG